MKFIDEYYKFNIKEYRRVFGDNSGRVTPVSISNTEVKPSSADGTPLVTEWESRTSPETLLYLYGDNEIIWIEGFYVLFPGQCADV